MLPTFIIIGAMKCGTSSLWHYLCMHPEIVMSKVKELDFFILEKNYNKGLEWYQSNFQGQAKEYGEASPNYTKYPTFAGVPERMHSVVPDAKLIYVVRDPIDRIIAHYMHNYSLHREDGSIYQALADPEDNYYVACSKYYMQLQQYMKYYAPENILVISSDELRDQRRVTLRTVFNFLNVSDTFDSPEYDKVLHKTAAKIRRNKLGRYLSKSGWGRKLKPFMPSTFVDILKKVTGRAVQRPELDEALRQRLVACLKEDVESLRKHTGNAFEGWCL